MNSTSSVNIFDRAIVFAKAIIIATVIAPVSAHAQDEVGIDLNVTTEKKFNSRLDGELTVNTRAMYTDADWYTERISMGAALGYKLVNTKKFDLKANAAFEYIHQSKPQVSEYTQKNKLKITEKRNYDRTRTSLGLGASYKPNKRWTFALKETVQYNHYGAHQATVLKFDPKYSDGQYYYNYDEKVTWNENRENSDDDEIKDFKAKDRFVLRNRLTVKYDIRHSIFTPYASVEYGCGLNYTTSKWKYTAGTEIQFTKLHNLDVFYRYQTEDDDDEPNGHILGIGYILKF